MSPIKYAYKNFKQQSAKGILISIVLATMLITAVFNMVTTFQNTIYQEAVAQSSNAHGKFRFEGTTTQEDLRKEPSVNWAELMSNFSTYATSDKTDAEIYLSSLSNIDKGLVEGFRIVKGRGPQNIDEVAVSPQAAQAMGIEPKIGESFTIKYNLKKPAERRLTITGILENQKTAAASNVYMIFVSKELIDTDPNSISTIMVQIKKGYEPISTLNELKKSFGFTDLQFNYDYISMNNNDPGTIIMALIAVFILLATGALVIYNAFYIMVTKRIHSFGMLTLIGASKKQVRHCIYFEGLLYCTLATPIGLALGTALSFAALPLLRLITDGIDLIFSASPQSYLITAILSILMVLIGVMAPARKASKITPTEAIRFSSAQSFKPRKSRKEIQIKDLAQLNMKRSTGRTVVTILTLCISGVLFLLISTISTFMLANMDSQITSIVGGDVQIIKGTQIGKDFSYNENDNPITPDVIANVKALEGVDHTEESYNIWYNQKKESTGIITAVNDKLFEQMLVAAGANGGIGAALLHYYLPSTTEYNQGDDIQINADGKDYTLKMAGLVKNLPPTGMLISGRLPSIFISQSTMRALSLNGFCESINIYAKNGYQESLTKEVEAFALSIDKVHTESRLKLKEEWTRQFIGMISLVMAIIAIIAAVGLMNLISSTLIGIQQRKREFGVLRAVGLSTNGIFKVLRLEAVFISTISTIASAVLGIGLGYTAYLNLRELNGYTDFVFPFIPLLGLCLVFALVPIITIKIAANQLKKDTIVNLLGQDG